MTDSHRHSRRQGIMEPKQRRFILLSTPRAGTHMVRSALDQHPQICCFGEIFHPKRNKWYPECIGMGARQLQRWMSESTNKPRVGFAIHIPGQANAVAKDYWATTHHDPRMPIVYVFRRNQLRQTLSLYRSRHAHALKAAGGYMSYKRRSPDFHRFGWNVQDLKEIDKIPVPCREFHDTTVEREANEIIFFAQRRFRRICPVAYEDYVTDPAAELKRISEFLEVDFHLVEPQTEKTGSGSLGDMIANIDEFNAYFSRTPYARWLSDAA